MDRKQLREIEDFWRHEIHDGYDDIVDVKQMARSDVYQLINEIDRLNDELKRR